MFKKIFLGFIVSFFVMTPVFAASLSMAQKMSGKFLLQIELYGRVWYVNPNDSQRYYITKGDEGYQSLLSLALKISEKDLSRIPENNKQRGDAKIINRLLGRILWDSAKNQLWYLNPSTKTRILIDPQNAVKSLSPTITGIKNKQLALIPMNNIQIAFDGTFNNVAHVKYDGKNFSNGYYADKVLPPASMTKLMTAIVLMDLKFDFNQLIQINDEQISYPSYYVGGDKTSEIDLVSGDWLSANDLFVALLVASSNQSAAILADATGLSRAEFIDLMNKKAKSLGLKKTIFHDVSGLDSHNLTTAKEMAIIAKTAFDNPIIAQTSIIKEYTIQAQDKDLNQKTIPVQNRNYSLLQFNPDGVKTGYLVEAQRTMCLKKGDEIIVVMHALSMNQRNNIINKLLN